MVAIGKGLRVRFGYEFKEKRVSGDVVIVGAGIIGLSTAKELVDAGYSVTVIERNKDIALEASYANGGLLTPSMSDPWNSPQVWRKLIASIFDPASALKLHLSQLPVSIPWGFQFLKNSGVRAFIRAMEDNFRLANYSMNCFREKILSDSTSKIDLKINGTIKFFRDGESYSKAKINNRILEEIGCVSQYLSPTQTLEIEPALGIRPDEICGSIYYPEDGHGDAYLYSKYLKSYILGKGVRILYNTEVSSFNIDQGKIKGVYTLNGHICSDVVIVSAGVWSKNLLSSGDIKLSLIPVKGYSITLALPVGCAIPTIPVVDDFNHAAVTPFDESLRLVGTAEIYGYNRKIEKTRIDPLFEVYKKLYPVHAKNTDYGTASPWVGFRPVSSDGKPFIDKTRIDGLFVNCGHGHLGWSMSAGSARIMKDLIDGSKPDIDSSPFSINR